MRFKLFFLGTLLLITPLLCAEEKNEHEKRIKVEWELDAYYTSVGLYSSLTTKPIPHMGRKKEWEIYKELMKRFYLPRTAVLEASINPLPYASTLVKRHARSFFNSMQMNDSVNLFQAFAEGFEEPWALSLFLGDVISFGSSRKAYVGKRHGYIGYLLSAGNFHIKDSELIPDNWLEAEWKIKGDQIFKERTLRWSFRTGMKFHENSGIKDIFYVAFRRSRTDYESSQNFFLDNSSYEYTFDFSQSDFRPMRHFFTIGKKIPFSKKQMALDLVVGFVWTNHTKYSGSLETPPERRDPFQLVFRPNLEF